MKFAAKWIVLMTMIGAGVAMIANADAHAGRHATGIAGLVVLYCARLFKRWSFGQPPFIRPPPE